MFAGTREGGRGGGGGGGGGGVRGLTLELHGVLSVSVFRSNL